MSIKCPRETAEGLLRAVEEGDLVDFVLGNLSIIVDALRGYPNYPALLNERNKLVFDLGLRIDDLERELAKYES